MILQNSEDDKKISQVWSLIRSIDKDRNGFVTITELDDIFKIVYEKELADKNLIPILKPFCSL